MFPFIRIFSHLKKEKDWEKAFRMTFHIDQDLFEKRVLDSIRKNYKNRFFMDIHSLLWTLIPISAITAIIISRYRRRKIYKKWEEEEFFYQ